MVALEKIIVEHYYYFPADLIVFYKLLYFDLYYYLEKIHFYNYLYYYLFDDNIFDLLEIPVTKIINNFNN